MNTLTNNKYLINCSRLVKSFIYKSHIVAVHMNKILSKYGVEYDTYNKYTWPYYLNICGLPHTANTDIKMISLDTSTEFIITRESLKVHKRTHSKLLEFGEIFDILIDKYPGQELYIRGLITDVTQDMLNTYDGAIIYYNKNLVEINEVNLINELSLDCGRFIERWTTARYIVTDDEYATAIYSTLNTYAIHRLLYLRLNNITTKEIHTYYQDLILSSNFSINEHKKILNKQSTIWLVKNIKYIGQNIGSEKILNLLVKKVLSPSGFDVDEVFISNTFDKDDTLTTKDKVTGDINDIELSVLIPGLIFEDNLLEQYNVDSERYQTILNNLTRVRGVGERTKIILLKLKAFISNIELTNTELVQKSILRTIYYENTMYQFNTVYGKVIVNSNELFKSTLIALFRLYRIENYTTVNKIIIDNIFVVVDVDYDKLTTNDERKEKIKDVHSAINEILNSDIKDVDKQLLSKTLIDYEMTNSNNEILTTELEMLRKEITVVEVLEIDETLGDYKATDRLYNNDVEDTLTQIYKIYEKDFDIQGQVLKKLKNCQSLLNKLTSYTITTVIDPNAVGGNCEIEPNLTLEGETIIKVTDTTMDCKGAVAKIDSFGSEMVDELYLVGKDILREKETRVLVPDLNVHQELNDEFIKVIKPKLK